MEPSVSALGISAHEVPHAYQDAEGNRSCRAPRSIGEPLAALSPRLTDAEEEQGVRRVLTGDSRGGGDEVAPSTRPRRPA